MKTCSRCKQEKPLDSFGLDKNRKDLKCPWCFECKRAVSLAYGQTHKEQMRERGKKWYEENKVKKNAQSRAWALDNPQKRRAIYDKWREANPDKARQACREWYVRNRESSLAADKARREANIEAFLEKERLSYIKHAEARRKKSERWRAANPDRVNFYASIRRSAIAKRSPPWLTHQDFEDMRAFFLGAKTLEKGTGIKYHVDHVIPLRGKKVSGLNVPWNLQILPAIVNLKKSNKHEI